MQTVTDTHPLRRARSAVGLSQRELSRLSGVRHATISEFETRKVDPYTKTVKKLAAVLDCPPHELIEWHRVKA